LEVADRRGLLLHLPRRWGSLARPAKQWGRLGRRRSAGILEAGDVVDLRGRRSEEVMGVLTRRVLLMLVGVRWVRGRVLRKRRGWFVGWVVRRWERSSQPKREPGMAVSTRHGDRDKRRSKSRTNS
jgi:hypothetical protein